MGSVLSLVCLDIRAKRRGRYRLGFQRRYPVYHPNFETLLDNDEWCEVVKRIQRTRLVFRSKFLDNIMSVDVLHISIGRVDAESRNRALVGAKGPLRALPTAGRLVHKVKHSRVVVR
jgi:hypothetical protein